MANYQIQIRITHRIKRELCEASRVLDLPEADIIRSALYFGLPTVVAMSRLQEELVKRLIKQLKGDSRLRKASSYPIKKKTGLQEGD